VPWLGQASIGWTLRFVPWGDLKAKEESVRVYQGAADSTRMLQWVTTCLQGLGGLLHLQKATSRLYTYEAAEAETMRQAADAVYEAIFMRLDTDDNGVLDLEELAMALTIAAVAPPGCGEQMAKEYMLEIDANGDNQISKEEWVQFFRAVERDSGRPSALMLNALVEKFGLRQGHQRDRVSYV